MMTYDSGEIPVLVPPAPTRVGSPLLFMPRLVVERDSGREENPVCGPEEHAGLFYDTATLDLAACLRKSTKCPPEGYLPTDVTALWTAFCEIYEIFATSGAERYSFYSSFNKPFWDQSNQFFETKPEMAFIIACRGELPLTARRALRHPSVLALFNPFDIDEDSAFIIGYRNVIDLAWAWCESLPRNPALDPAVGYSTLRFKARTLKASCIEGFNFHTLQILTHTIHARMKALLVLTGDHEFVPKPRTCFHPHAAFLGRKTNLSGLGRDIERAKGGPVTIPSGFPQHKKRDDDWFSPSEVFISNSIVAYCLDQGKLESHDEIHELHDLVFSGIAEDKAIARSRFIREWRSESDDDAYACKYVRHRNGFCVI